MTIFALVPAAALILRDTRADVSPTWAQDYQ
jgi:hypothetical protein